MEDTGQGRMCATNSLIVFVFLNGLEASPPKTLQGVVISATSGLLFHISQLGGNQIRSDEPRSTHKPVWPHRLTRTHTGKWCNTHKQAGARKPRRVTHTNTHANEQVTSLSCGFFKKWMDGPLRRVCQSEDVMCAPRHVLESDHLPTILSQQRDIAATWSLSLSLHMSVKYFDWICQGVGNPASSNQFLWFLK